MFDDEVLCMLTQKIMIIDSDPEITDQIQFRIEDYGFECFSYSSQEDALHDFHALHPDLIIMDEEYARSEGLKFLNKLFHSLEDVETMPAIKLINGSDDHEWLEYAHDVGAHSLQNNSYDFYSLKAMMSDYLPNEEELGLKF